MPPAPVVRSLGSRIARVMGIAMLASSAVFAAACSQPAPSETKTAPPPAAPAAASAPKLYVTDETDGNIVVIDAGTGQVLSRLAAGKRPRGIRLSRDGKQLFVAFSGSPIAGPNVDESKLPPPDRAADGIGIIDLATMKVLRTLPSGQDPETFDTSMDGSTIYVSNEDAAKMTVLSIQATAAPREISVGEEPEGVKVRPDGRVVYVTCEGTHEVVAVDTTSLAVVARIVVGQRPRDIVFTPDSAIGFVTNETDGTVSVIETKGHTIVKTIKLPPATGVDVAPPRPMSGVMAPDHKQLYVSLGRARAIAVIDVATQTVLRLINGVGARPWGIDISADGKTLYTANGGSGDVSIVDIASGTVTKIATGGSPWGVVVAR